jgi:hypothetical protein
MIHVKQHEYSMSSEMNNSIIYAIPSADLRKYVHHNNDIWWGFSFVSNSLRAQQLKIVIFLKKLGKPPQTSSNMSMK